MLLTEMLQLATNLQLEDLMEAPGAYLAQLVFLLEQ